MIDPCCRTVSELRWIGSKFLGSISRRKEDSTSTSTVAQTVFPWTITVDSMRRIINIRQPSRLLGDCSCSSRPAVSSAPASRCLVQHHQQQQQYREFSSPAARRPHVQAHGIPGTSRSYAQLHLKPKSPLRNYEPRNGQVEEYLPEQDPDVDLVDADIVTEIKAPGRLKSAPKPDDVESVYTPALTAEGLEEVGGVADWWEDDRHWSPSMEYVGFGPREKITDPAVLEALTRRAVVEALAVREVEGEAALGGSWQEGGREALLKALEVGIVVDENGAVALSGDVAAVVEGLKVLPEAQELAQQGQEEFVLPADQAIQFRKSWDKSWKTISLEDPRLKFAVRPSALSSLCSELYADASILG